MNKRIQIAAAVAVSFGLLAACGGGDDEATATEVADTASSTEPAVTEPEVTDPPATDPPTTEPPATDPPATDPPVTDPPVTDPPEADLPDWASGAMVTVESDTGSIEIPVELVSFCEASRSFYVAAKGLDFVGDGQARTAQQLFAVLGALAPVTIETAPSEDFAAEPTAAQEQLAVIIPAFEEIGYDTTRLSELSDPDAIVTAVQEFGATRESLRTFLVEACGADGDVLDDQARKGADIAAESAGEAVAPDEPVEAVEGVPVTNAASTIAVSVPADWTEVEDTVESGRDQLVVSPDVDGFFDLSAAGVLVLRGEGGLRDGGFGGRVFEIRSDLEAAGCAEVDERDYDDGFYLGREVIFDCGSGEFDVRVLGGTTVDEARYAMALIVYPSDEPGIRQLIVDTFEVR